MPFEHLDWIRQLKAVEREFSAAKFAADSLFNRAKMDPSTLDDVRIPDINRARLCRKT